MKSKIINFSMGAAVGLAIIVAWQGIAAAWRWS